MLLLVPAWSRAQEVQFAQFYNDPYQLNPALSGASKYNRVGVHMRDQWPGIKNNYKSYSMLYDMRLDKINSGFGAYVLQDVAGDGALTFTSASLSFAYGAMINMRQMIRFGIRTSFNNRRIDFNRLLFADQILRETTGASVEGFNVNQVSYVEFSAGVEYKIIPANFRVGVAVDHLNRANQSFTNFAYKLPIRTSAYIIWDKYVQSVTTSATPVYMTFAALYKTQLNWDQIDVGSIYHYGPMEFGIFYRGIPGLKAYQPGYTNNAAIIGYLGYQWLNMHVGYNYDFTVSKLSNAHSHGAHEVTLLIAWNKSFKKKKPRSIPCSDIVGTSSVKKVRF